jgi:5-formyltetrahydrofolate cyclo-ligase
MDESNDTLEQKQAIRREALARRKLLPEKDSPSAAICQRLFKLKEYTAAGTVLFYVNVRSEVRTRPTLTSALNSEKRIVVPYCVDDRLELFHLESLDELEPAAFGILEPKAPLRELAERHLDPKEIDFVIAPGVAFDRRGGRLGHGLGYYDRLLQRLRPEAVIVGLAFECQLFNEIPMSSHDVFMDVVVTESAVYEGRRRLLTSAS